MNRSRTTRATRRRQALAALVCGPALLLASSVNVWAQAQDAVTRVEEDWVMVLVEPEAGRCSPQFHTTMSPRGDLDGTYVQMCWNYRDDPDFAAGGMQMHAWKQEDELRTRSADLGNFSNAAETARWTQVMGALRREPEVHDPERIVLLVGLVRRAVDEPDVLQGRAQP